MGDIMQNKRINSLEDIQVGKVIESSIEKLGRGKLIQTEIVIFNKEGLIHTIKQIKYGKDSTQLMKLYDLFGNLLSYTGAMSITKKECNNYLNAVGGRSI
jgi:hypothetical protein